jgi:hypothetical protein
VRRLVSFVCLATLLTWVSVAAAQQANDSTVPSLIRYGGTLARPSSAAVPSKITGVTFAIYRQQDGGAPVWMETQNVTTDATGHYSVLLGSTTSTGLPSDLFSAQEERWLGVQVQGQAEQPRVLLVSVPYAMKAAEADRLAGHSASEFVTTDNLQSAVQQQLQQQANGPSQARTTAVGVSSNGTSAPYINNGTVLQTGASFNIDGTGTAATVNATGNYNLAGTPVLGNSGTQGMFVGAGAGTNNTGTYNLFLGIAAGHNTTAADFNTFIGTNAGYLNTTGTQNFMLGADAGYHNTTGSYNMFVGSLAGYSNTTGTRNAFVGRAAGYGNTTGTGNSFFGTNAGTASTANFNTFLGGFSGSATTTGTQNTFVGWQAGQFNVTGSNNLFLGYNAGSAGGTTSNNDVYIASPGAGNETGVIRIGATGQTAAYMAGIYGNAPSGALPVVINSSGQLGTTTGGIGVTSFNGRTGAVMSAPNDYSFSQINGTLLGSQLSGPYSNAVTLSNPANVFYGNGSHLTGVTAGAGSPYYIQNGTALQPGANFNISGNGTLGGILTANSGVVASNIVPGTGAIVGNNLTTTSQNGSAGVGGVNNNDSSGTGVYGENDATGGGSGVNGQDNNTTGMSAGVYAVTKNPTGVAGAFQTKSTKAGSIILEAIDANDTPRFTVDNQGSIQVTTGTTTPVTVSLPVNHARADAVGFASDGNYQGTVDLTWAFPFPDASYTVTCTIQSNATDMYVNYLYVAAYGPTGLTASYYVATDPGVPFTIHCLGVHD